MRTAILTDIHANIEALTACIAAAEAQKVDRFVCLGDTVGYGADPNAACDLVRSKCAFTVLGNHDAAVAGRMDYSYYYAAAREVLDWTALHLSAENMQWLRALPYQHPDGEVFYGHASPRDPRAGYGIWDDQAKIVEFHRVQYNAEKTARKILEAGLSPHFARRLLHGV